MSKGKPVIFLTFANDQKGRFLEALRPEQAALHHELSKYQDQGWGLYHSTGSSNPDLLIKDLNQFTGRLIIFHYSGHANGEGLQLESLQGGKIFLHGAELSKLLKDEARRNLKLVFLNACMTEGLVQSFQDLGVQAVIATNTLVPDTLAKEFSEAFYRSLVSGNTLDTAFNQARISIEKGRVDADKFRAMEREEQSKKKEFPWELHTLTQEIKDWTLFHEAPEDTRSSPYPHELNFIPGINPDFVGREAELAELQEKLGAEKALLLLNGLGGIGKTTLARQFVHRHKHSYDHIAWVSVLFEPDQKDQQSGGTTLEALSRDQELFASLGLEFNPQMNEQQRAGLILQTLRQKVPGKNLLVIDNAGKSLEGLTQYLPQPPGWQVLVTSREELNAFTHLRLDELTPAEAEELFLKLYPKGKKEKEKVEELIEYVGRHTLTLELLARSCKASPLSLSAKKVLDKLQNKELKSLSKKVWTDRSQREVEVYSYLMGAFELSGLHEVEKALLTQWAILPSEDLEMELLPRVFNLSEPELEAFEDSLMGLIQKGWLMMSEDQSKVRMHQMIQELIRYQLPPDLSNCQGIIEGVTSLIAYEENKDNPAHHFVYLPLGDALLLYLPKEGGEISYLQDRLGRLYRQAGNYQRALELHENALAIVIKLFGEDHTTIGTRRNELALDYYDLGQYDKAIELFEKALASCIKDLGEDHTSVATSRNNLGIVYRDLGQYDKAIELFEKALESDIKNFGEAHSNVATTRNELGQVYNSLGQYDKAIELYEKALASFIEELGEDHPNVAIGRNNLGMVYRAIGQYEKALDLYKKAIASDIKNFGEEHPQVAIRWNNLGLVYKHLGQFDKTQELYQKALASDIKNFGEEHPKIAYIRNNLASVYSSLGRTEEAKAQMQAAYEILFKHLGPDHPNTVRVKENLESL